MHTLDPFAGLVRSGDAQISHRALGPQLPGESGLSRRIRFHQSWYRLAVLGRPEYGALEGPRPRPLGSVLSADDAQRGYNFVSSGVFDLYRERRKEGWGVDPVRCLKYMTSSQALTLNIAGVLASDSKWLVAVFSLLLGRTDILALQRCSVEFAPSRPSDHLGDKTRVDLLVELETTDGLDVVVIEVKLADRFNSRHVEVWKNGRYRDLAKTTGMWRTADPRLRARSVNQLLRCHALGASMLGSATAKSRPPTLAIIYHPDDLRVTEAVAPYLSVLQNPRSLVLWPLNDLLSIMEDTGTTSDQVNQARDLRTRYVDHGLSKAAWIQHLR